MTSAESRADRFARELADLKISDPASGHPRGWQRLGGVLMIAGIVLSISSFGLSSFAHADAKQPAKSSHRRHRGDSADNAKDEPPKSEQAQLAEKIANCKDDPICGM